jgi:hypothetical protein
MRASVLLLPLLLVISPGDGSTRCPQAAPPAEVWNPLRPWQHLPGEAPDSLRGAVPPTPLLASFVDGVPVVRVARDLLACPMPVAPVPLSHRLPAPVSRGPVSGDSAVPMPTQRSGCWNPLFSLARRVPGDSLIR